MMTFDDLAGLAQQVCPMHVIIDADGTVVSHGPTLLKLCDGGDWKGKSFFDVLDLQRPRWVQSISDLIETAGSKLHFQLRAEPHTRMKGVLVPLPDGQGAFINLSFGISVLDAVRDFNLTSQDFSPPI